MACVSPVTKYFFKFFFSLTEIKDWLVNRSVTQRFQRIVSTWRTSRDSVRPTRPSRGARERDVTAGRGRGARPRVWCTCADRLGSRWPRATRLASVPCCRSEYSTPFTSARLRGLHYRYSLKRGYHCNFCACGIYVSILWTPTLLVHHLLSQSSRLTRRIDMRQARDIVSIISRPNICMMRYGCN